MTLEFNKRWPLAASYNERTQIGWDAGTQAGFDQRKINSWYEIANNQATGKTTLMLCKRPGITRRLLNTTLTSSVDVRLIVPYPGDETNRIAIGALGTSTIAYYSTDSLSSLISISTWANNARPVYWSRTLLNNDDTTIVQLARGGDVNVAHCLATFFATSAIAAFVPISSSVYTGLIQRGQMEHLDGFAFQMESRNRIYNSDLNTLHVWQTNSYIQKSIQQDSPSGLIRYKKQLLAFGDQTMEVFVNAGNPAGSPLNSVPSLAAKVGLCVPAPSLPLWFNPYSATIADRVYFIGVIAGGTRSPSVLSYNGGNIEKVSNIYIDKMLYGRLIQNFNNDFISTGVYACGVFGKPAVAITMEDSRWLMFFPEEKEWFEWHSGVFTPINYGGYYAPRTGVSSLPHVMSYGFVSAADKYVDGGLLTSGVSTSAYTFTHQFQIPDENGESHTMQAYGVTGDTISSAVASTLSVSFSDDDTTNYVAAGAIDMSQRTKYLTRGGSYFRRMVQLSHSDNAPVRLTQFIARVV